MNHDLLSSEQPDDLATLKSSAWSGYAYPQQVDS